MLKQVNNKKKQNEKLCFSVCIRNILSNEFKIISVQWFYFKGYYFQMLRCVHQ
jgi:hypothetical protein